MSRQLQTRTVRQGRRQHTEVRDPETGRWRRVVTQDPRNLALPERPDDILVPPPPGRETNRPTDETICPRGDTLDAPDVPFDLLPDTHNPKP